MLRILQRKTNLILIHPSHQQPKTILTSLYSPFSTGSDPQNNKNQSPKNQKDPHSIRKVTFGRKFTHPLKQFYFKKKKVDFQSPSILAQKLLNFKNDLEKQVSERIEKEKNKQKKKQQQKEEQPQPEEELSKKNITLQRLITLSIAYVFAIFLLGNTSDEPSIRNKKKGNNELLLKEIDSNPEVQKVLIEKGFYSKIGVTLLTVTNKRAEFVFEQEEIPEFLKNLETIRGGTVQVQFIFHPDVNVDNKPSKRRAEIIHFMIKVAVIGGIIYLFRRMGREMGSGVQEMFKTNKFKPVKPQNIEIYFKDVAGMHEAKFQVTEFVDFLKEPQKYIDMGAKVPKGALLTGPPGTGKTLLAKACAGEAGVPFFSVSGSDFVERFVGLGASRVRSLFDEAQKNSPSIIFIDEIDAIGKKRDGGPFSNEERDNTLNQLLVRMDGFDTQNKVIVMAATNRKDMLDPALLRPGRFDRSVQIGIPNFEERKQILKVHLKKVKYDPSISEEQISKKIATITPGFSGAELANTCNEAAILAARQDLPFIPFAKFEKATERVMAGLEKRNLFTEEEKQMLAYYECGKAVASWYTQGADPIIKISIIPYSKSNQGFSHSIRDETALNTMNELLDKACCYLAGRAAEKHFKGYITTNGDKDIERARRILTYIVTKFGMSQALNMIAFPDFDFTRKPYSQKTESIIDEQIRKLTDSVQERVQKLIKEKEQKILLLKEELMKHQTLTHNGIKNVLGDREFESNQNYNRYLQDQEEPSGVQGPGSITASKQQTLL